MRYDRRAPGREPGAGSGGTAVRGLAILGAVGGLLLAAGAGTSAVGGMIVGALAGALLIPVLRLVGWLTVTAVKIALAALVLLIALALLGALAGGGG